MLTKKAAKTWNGNPSLKQALLLAPQNQRMLLIRLIYFCFPRYHAPTNSLAPQMNT